MNRVPLPHPAIATMGGSSSASASASASTSGRPITALGHPLMSANPDSAPHPAAVAAANALAASATSSHSPQVRAAAAAAAAPAQSHQEPDGQARPQGSTQDALQQEAGHDNQAQDQGSQEQEADQQRQQQQAAPPAPAAPMVPPPAIPDTVDELHAQESHVDADLLKTAGNLSTTTPYTLPAGMPALGPFGLAHARSPFVLTVLAVHAIVNGKLYKHAGANLEDYFKSRFGISRAQVYRVLDCAALYMDFELRFPSLPLHLLEPYPLKQRLCKTIRSLAPTPYLRQLLWHCTLRKWVVPPPPPTRDAIVTTQTIINSDGEEEEVEVEHPPPPPLPAAVISVDELTSKHVRDVWDLLVLRADVRQLLELAITQVNDMYNAPSSAAVTHAAAAAAAAAVAASAGPGSPTTTSPLEPAAATSTAAVDAQSAPVSGNSSTSNLSATHTPSGGSTLGLIQGPLGLELPSIPYVSDAYAPRTARERSPNANDPRPTKRPRRSTAATGGSSSSTRGRRVSQPSTYSANSSNNQMDLLAPPPPSPPANATSAPTTTFQPLSTHADGHSPASRPLPSPLALHSPGPTSAADLMLLDDAMDADPATAYAWHQITAQYANATAASLAAYARGGAPPPPPPPPEIPYSRLRADSPRSPSPLGESDDEEFGLRMTATHDAPPGAANETGEGAETDDAPAPVPPIKRPGPAPPARIGRPAPPPAAAFTMATPQSRSGVPSPLLIHHGHLAASDRAAAAASANGLGLRINSIVRPTSLYSSTRLPPVPACMAGDGGSSAGSSRNRSRNGTEGTRGTGGDSPMFSMVPGAAAGMLAPTSVPSPFAGGAAAMYPPPGMHAAMHPLHMPLGSPTTAPPSAHMAPAAPRTVADLDIHSHEMHDFLCATIESLQELARRGVVLQPLVNSVWLNDVTHWRFYTMQSPAPATGQNGVQQAVGVGETTKATGSGEQDGTLGAEGGGAAVAQEGPAGTDAPGALQVNGLDLVTARAEPLRGHSPPAAARARPPARPALASSNTTSRPPPTPSAPAPAGSPICSPASLTASGMPRSDSGMALPLPPMASSSAAMAPPGSGRSTAPATVSPGYTYAAGEFRQPTVDGFGNASWPASGKPGHTGWQQQDHGYAAQQPHPDH